MAGSHFMFGHNELAILIVILLVYHIVIQDYAYNED